MQTDLDIVLEWLAMNEIKDYFTLIQKIYENKAMQQVQREFNNMPCQGHNL